MEQIKISLNGLQKKDKHDYLKSNQDENSKYENYILESFPNYKIDYTVERKIDNGEIVPGLLGKGGFGRVYACVDTTCFNEPRAVKIVKDAENHPINEEFRIQHKYGNKGAVRLYGHHTIHENDDIIYVVSMERMDGTLKDMMEKAGKPFDEVETIRILEKIFPIIEILHNDKNDENEKKGTTHGDLKPENIMYMDTYRGKEYKLGDFGCTRSTEKTCSMWAGTEEYCLNHTEWDTPRDIYAIGMMVMEMVGADIRDKDKYGERYQPETMWSDVEVDSEFREICRLACSTEQKKRMSITEMRNMFSDWMKSHPDKVKIHDSNGKQLYDDALALLRTGELSDRNRAVRFLTGSGAKGHSPANYQLAILLEEDHEEDEAERNLSVSAELGYAPALNRLAVKNLKKLGPDGDAEQFAEMVEKLRIAAVELPAAKYNLALLLRCGMAVPVSPDENWRVLLQEAAEAGYEPAKVLCCD